MYTFLKNRQKKEKFPKFWLLGVLEAWVGPKNPRESFGNHSGLCGGGLGGSLDHIWLEKPSWFNLKTISRDLALLGDFPDFEDVLLSPSRPEGHLGCFGSIFGCF